MAGAHVFPGGRVDATDDLGADAARCCDGVDSAVAQMPSRPPAEAIAFHVAAVRELFEEAGVLLARSTHAAAGGANFDPARLTAWRRELIEQRATIAEIAAREALRLTLDALTPFAEWVTPEIELRRFDTSFFFAVAPAFQDAAHDDHEATHGAWVSPEEAIERCRGGEIALPPPTWTTLRALSRFQGVEEAEAWARQQRAPRVQPRVVERADGTRCIMLPGDPSCPPVAGFAASETRFLLENGRWRPVEPD